MESKLADQSRLKRCETEDTIDAVADLAELTHFARSEIACPYVLLLRRSKALGQRVGIL